MPTSPRSYDVGAAVGGALDQRRAHRGRGEAHVAADRDPARLEVLDVGAADRVRALLVELVGVDAADVVGLEGLGIEHGHDAMGTAVSAMFLRRNRAQAHPHNYNQTVERKLATVLFVDLVGSTELVAASDPEIVRRRVNSFFEHVSHCIATHGGIVEKFAGDAVMAAFGIPQAHEDDAERAVRAAAAILDSVHGLGLEARIGVEAGEVVADDSDSTFATGEAVNLAARLQQAAAPGEILIGPFAHRLTVGVVETEERGELELKGFGEPLIAWRLHCVLDTGDRVPRVAASFVAREFELELLHNTLSRVIRDKRLTSRQAPSSVPPYSMIRTPPGPASTPHAPWEGSAAHSTPKPREEDRYYGDESTISQHGIQRISAPRAPANGHRAHSGGTRNTLRRVLAAFLAAHHHLGGSARPAAASAHPG